jgi:hypothetical protein
MVVLNHGLKETKLNKLPGMPPVFGMWKINW